MTIAPPVKLLLIYVGETDLWGEQPLYEAIVLRLLQLGIAGATAQVGIMGYGTNQRLHRKRLFGVSDDRPVTVSVVENETKLRALLPEITPMVREGLIFLVDGELLHHGLHPESPEEPPT